MYFLIYPPFFFKYQSVNSQFGDCSVSVLLLMVVAAAGEVSQAVLSLSLVGLQQRRFNNKNSPRGCCHPSADTRMHVIKRGSNTDHVRSGNLWARVKGVMRICADPPQKPRRSSRVDIKRLIAIRAFGPEPVEASVCVCVCVCASLVTLAVNYNSVHRDTDST